MALFFSILSIFLIATLGLAMQEILPDRAEAAVLTEDSIKATGACVVDADSGQILYAKQEDSKLNVGELSHMAVALIASGELDFKDRIKVGGESVAYGTRGIALQEGEDISVESLMQALLKRSARDAASALAVATSGSNKAFIDKEVSPMLEKLGCKDTSFSLEKTATNISTPREISLIARDFANKKGMLDIAKGEALNIPATNMSLERTYPSLTAVPDKYGKIDGVQMTSQNTDNSKYCFVAHASQKDMNLIMVLIGEPTKKDCFKDAEKLADFGLTSFKRVMVATTEDIVDRIEIEDGSFSRVPLGVKEDFTVLVDKAVDDSMIEHEVVLKDGLSAPMKKGTEVGYLLALDAGREVARKPLYLRTNVGHGGVAAKLGLPVWGFWTVMAVIAIILFFFIRRKIKKRAARNRMKAREQARREEKKRREEKRRKIKKAKAKRREDRGWKY